MTQDHILLTAGQCKILQSLFESRPGMGKAVHAIVKMSVMPVIHKIIMKQCTADQFPFIDADSQLECDKISCCRNADTMFFKERISFTGAGN